MDGNLYISMRAHTNATYAYMMCVTFVHLDIFETHNQIDIFQKGYKN